MFYEETPGLEKFVLNYLQRAGALTEQESYATLGVLLPDEDQVRAFTVLYNPLSNEIEMPVCESCGKQTTSLVPDQADFVCPECSVGGRKK